MRLANDVSRAVDLARRHRAAFEALDRREFFKVDGELAPLLNRIGAVDRATAIDADGIACWVDSAGIHHRHA